MTTNSKIRFASMSLMWGRAKLANDQLENWLNDVCEAGYDGVACFDGELTRFVEETPFANLLRDRGLSLASVDFDICEDMDRVKRVCEIMQSLGCPYLVTIGGIGTRDADMLQIANILDRTGEIALSYDILACYHNHSGYIAETLEESERLLKLTNPRKFFGFVDVGHATADFAGHPVASRAQIFLERNWDRIRFLEFKDWSSQADMNVVLGEGEADWDSLFAFLKQRRYQGWITVEQNRPTGDRSCLECASASRAFIRDKFGA